MSENRPSPPSSEFLDSIHPQDLVDFQVAALLAEVETAFPSVERRHGELLALTDWLISYGDLLSADQQEVSEKEQLVKNIAASFFLDSSRQVEALTDDYEDKVFVGEV